MNKRSRMSSEETKYIPSYIYQSRGLTVSPRFATPNDASLRDEITNMSGKTGLFTTLIRTHHVTSRKKLHRVRKAAAQRMIPFVLVRYGGSPGIMYAESPDEASLNSWVTAVHDLRYKDFHCVQKPSGQDVVIREKANYGPFKEVESVADFGDEMDRRGLGAWWRAGMGYQGHE